jgi:hypothetical protein
VASIVRGPRIGLAGFTRWSAAALAVLAAVVLVLAFAEAWSVDHPLWQVVVKGRWDGLSITLLVLCVLAVVPLLDVWILKDYEFLFGIATFVAAALAIFATLTALMPWIRFSGAAGARWFAILLVLWLLALVTIAYEWVRRNLILASVVTVLALGGFIARAGYDDLRSTEHGQRTDAVAAATGAQAQLAAAIAPQALADDAKSARQDLVAVLFEVTPANIPAALRQAAADIYRNTPTTFDQPVNQALVDNFDQLAANQPQNTAPVVIGLRNGVHAFVAAVDAAAARFSSPAAVLGGKLQTAIDTAKANVDTRNWPGDEHAMNVALAAYRAAVTGTAADKSAYQAAANAPVPSADSGVGLLDAVTDGPQALWVAATGKNLRPLVPGPLGWVLLGALALGIWGALLRTNAMQAAGPVSIQDDGKNEKLLSVLRVAVLENLTEPGSAPGAGSNNPVTDLIEAVGGGLGPIGKILDVVYKVAGRRYGYEVTTDINVDDATHRTTVLVKLKSIAGQQTFATQRIDRDTGEEAMRVAGLWAAGKLLEMSTRVPSWAAWNADTAEALSTAFLDDPPIGQLETAVANAPGSGILLAMLGQRYERAGRRFDAIEVYARAVAAHPRYVIARYRLGAALAAMRDDVAWQQATKLERAQLWRCLDRAAVALRISATAMPLRADDVQVQRQMFMQQARRFLHELDIDTRLWHRLVAAFRRSERDAIAPVALIHWTKPGARFHPLVKSVCMAYADGKDFRADRLVSYASKPRRWWQVSYNAACGLAYHLPAAAAADSPAAATRDKQRDLAMSMLEQALLKPGIEQLSAEWVLQDIDLADLRGDPRFASYVKQLRTGT